MITIIPGTLIKLGDNFDVPIHAFNRANINCNVHGYIPYNSYMLGCFSKHDA